MLKYQRVGALVNRQLTVKYVHLASTVWFVLSAAYILVFVLRQAGFSWLVLFSFSGHSLLLVLLLTSLYLFAMFRGVDRNQKITVEHPLTTTSAYALFYDISPFLGGCAGWFATVGLVRPSAVGPSIALGTLCATFLVWILVDPAVALAERLLPASRAHWHQRLAKAEQLRIERSRQRMQLLANVEETERKQRDEWTGPLLAHAERLAEALACVNTDPQSQQQKARQLGLLAWQTGGINCMRQLHEMALNSYRRRHGDQSAMVDFIPTWWDGIGTWRNQLLEAS